MSALIARLDALDAAVKEATPGPWLACSLGTENGRRDAKGRTSVAGTHRQEGVVTLADSGGTRPAGDARLIVAAVNAAPGLSAIARAAAERPWWQHVAEVSWRTCRVCRAHWQPLEGNPKHKTTQPHGNMCCFAPLDAALDRAEAEAAR